MTGVFWWRICLSLALTGTDAAALVAHGAALYSLLDQFWDLNSRCCSLAARQPIHHLLFYLRSVPGSLMYYQVVLCLSKALDGGLSSLLFLLVLLLVFLSTVEAAQIVLWIISWSLFLRRCSTPVAELGYKLAASINFCTPWWKAWVLLSISIRVSERLPEIPLPLPRPLHPPLPPRPSPQLCLLALDIC